jgi:hypothetical protein
LKKLLFFIYFTDINYLFYRELIIDIKDKTICEMIMKTLTSKLMTIDFNELPPLVHQMLKLGYDHNTILLYSTLSKYFSLKYASLSDTTDSDKTSNLISK